MEKLKKDLLENSEKLVFGTRMNLRLLKNDGLKTIYIASNCMDAVKKEVKRYDGKTEVVELDVANDEIGVVCKKPFSISVIGLVK